MDTPTSRRIILLGKTGAGKSSLANTIFGEDVFMINHSPITETNLSYTAARSVSGRNITLIDTPGFFDTDRPEEGLKSGIVKCITECAPGPHAFLIVLKVEKFTEHEQAVINKIREYFTEDALEYAAIVFTHGDQLQEGMKLEEFVSQNKNLCDLVKKCGGRCHVVDNKYWKNNEEDNYRCNQVQVAKLLNTLDKMIEAHQGGCYTNEMLQTVERKIQREEKHIRQLSGDQSPEEIRNQAKISALDSLLIRSAGIATGALLGALLGVADMVKSSIGHLEDLSHFAASRNAIRAAAAQAGVKGGLTGYTAAEGAQSPVEAMQMAASAVWSQFGLSARQNDN